LTAPSPPTPHPSLRPPRRERGPGGEGAVELATVHALGWLAVACGVGMLLAVLLVAPGLNGIFGPLTYGRWMPLHLDLVLYGWLALPLVALLFRAFLEDGAEPAAEMSVRVWSGSLMVGAVGWLTGETTGKAFLDWSGVPRVLFLLSMVVLAGVLAAGLVDRWRAGRPVRGLWVLWTGLLTVPLALGVATSPSTYPPVNPDTGGPTGASLLGSTLCVIAILAGTPLLLGLARVGSMRRAAFEVFGALGVHSLFFAAVAVGDHSHREPLQVAAVASLLVWAWLLPRWLWRFEWPDGSRPWLLAFLAWGGALLATAVPMFLPGFLDRIKFTNALVGHAHLAMAGAASSFAALILVVVNDRTRLRGCLGDRGSFALWHGGNAVHVTALAAAGWIEALDPGAVFRGEMAITVCYLVRALAGAAMLAAAWRWVAVAVRRFEASRALTPGLSSAHSPLPEVRVGAWEKGRG
jgi:cytochrome c oxidase cbb3-type subunit 1